MKIGLIEIIIVVAITLLAVTPAMAETEIVSMSPYTISFDLGQIYHFNYTIERERTLINLPFRGFQ